jgi:hypothetical protein
LRRLALLAAVLATAACVSTNATRLGGAAAHAPVPESSVVIYRTAAQVPRKYEEVALLNSTGESSYTNEDKMFRSMKKKAGQLGANAIILDAVSEPSAGAKIAGAFLRTGAQRKGKAIAIYVEPSTGTK